MDHAARCIAVAEQLEALPDDLTPRSLIGFDGFIDHIIDVVDQRRGPDDFSAVPTIAALGERIAAAAGRSANIELAVRRSKIGGNGPIMAAAMAAAGHRIRYCGIVGENAVDPVFEPLAEAAEELVSLGAPASTDALEFDDGKVMLGKLTPLEGIDFDVLCQVLGVDGLRRHLSQVDGVATVNWTMTLAMTDIWRRLAEEILPGLRHDRPRWFVDLADPAKRTREDLAEALRGLQDLQRQVDVVLGLNGSEAAQVVQVLGGQWQGAPEDNAAAVAAATTIREELGLETVMVHLVASAAAAGSTAPEGVGAEGFRCDDPQITTGAGDHFNAGFFGSLLQGLDLQAALVVGGATSGFYVREARSPSRAEASDFLRRWVAQSMGQP